MDRLGRRSPSPPRSSILAVRVNRGPSLLSCSDAIAAAVVADIVAREQRDAAAQRRREEAFSAMVRRPLSRGGVDPRR
jgi:hypothetical protein